MNDLTFWQVQTAELRRLLDSAADDPLLEKQLRYRLADAEQKLDQMTRPEGMLLRKEPAELPRTAIFLRGQGVDDSAGIRPSLAGEALIQYEKMFIQQALHDEREAARKEGRQRRRRGTPTPALLFTGTPRGSFGLEFTPKPTEEAAIELHAHSLRNVSKALVLVSESEPASFEEIVKQIPSNVLYHMKGFMGTLAQHNAELRLAFSDGPSRRISTQHVQTAAALLEREFNQEEVTLNGTFRGVTLDTGRFDLKADVGELITGTVSDDLDEEDLVRISSLVTHPCVAKLQKITVRTVTGTATTTYVLLDAQTPGQSLLPPSGPSK